MTALVRREDAVPAGGGRFPRLIGARWWLLEAAALGAALAVFLVSVLPNLANHPTVTDDEVWVVSASFKLATQGVFGSDMFAGFYHADRVYLLNMPAHHFAVAAAFKLLGPGIVQARLVGVGYGIATLVLTYVLARRLFGVVSAVLALALLLFLRLNMGFDTGLPLQELSATVRYDLAPVPFMLAGALVLLGGASARRCAGAGALFGLAGLLQFYGVFALPVAVAFILMEPLALRSRLKLAALVVAAAGAVWVPYGAYVAANLDDFRGQVGTVDRRDDFGSARFYLENVLDEPLRFVRPLGFKEVPKGQDPRQVEPRYLSFEEMARRRPSAKLAVLAGLPLALAFTGLRGLRGPGRGERLVFLFLAGLPLQYALLEAAKLYIYWIPVVPFLCIGLAPALLWLLRPPAGRRLRLASAAVAAFCLLLVFAEGSAARLSGLRAASRETDYGALASLLQEHVPAESRVVGSTSLWWALRDTEFRSYFLLFYLTAPNAGPYRTTVTGFLDAFRPDYIVLTRLGTEELEKHLVAGDLLAYRAYLRRNAALVARLEGPEVRSYGYVEIWRFRGARAGPERSRAGAP